VGEQRAGRRGLHALSLTQEDIRRSRKSPQAIRRAQMPKRDQRQVDVPALPAFAEEATSRGLLQRRTDRFIFGA
jgi:hypothetical protein